MTRTKSTYLALLAVLLSPMAANADVIITHGSGNFNFGPFGGIASFANFDEARFSFASTTTSSVDISGVTGFIDPGCCHPDYPVIIDLWDGSAWINIFTSAVFSVDTDLIDILPATISFAAMTASGLRLRSDDYHGWNFHGVSASMEYAVRDAVAVPEPSTLALLGIGLLGMGAARRRKKS